STAAGSLRPPMVGSALGRMFAGSYQLLAAQEISSTGNAEVLTSLLPAAAPEWNSSFFDTNDTQDNGFWFRPPVQLNNAMPLFATSMIDASGRIITDSSQSLHPPQAGHFTIGDFDFTLITLHLTFAGGDTSESARELRVLLDYLDSYFQQPGHDPDVIICGDFNTPSHLSGQTGQGGIRVDPIFDSDQRFQTGERRFVVTVHEPTSRTTAANGGLPLNNYDHFIFSADIMEELIQARRVAPDILTAHPDDPEQRLTSDHFPIVAFLKTTGEGIARDIAIGPRITSVLNGASFLPGITPGSWVTIYGSALASTARLWRSDEIVGGVFPVALDGVEVRINGRAAAVNYISPTQVNVQAPDDSALGIVSVEVIRDGISSGIFSAELRSHAPGFFVFAPAGAQYIAAVHLDGTLVGKPGLFGGSVTTRPVKSGDVISLFGTGFGPTQPPVPSGRVLSATAFLTSDVMVRFNGMPAADSFAGLSAAGLNQINLVVPAGLPNGDVAVVAEIAGQTTQAGLLITVQQPFPSPDPDPGPEPSPGDIVISQIYGGGGNQGAPLRNDFIELFNRGGASVDITGWTVQYASASGSQWSSTALSGTVLAGQYYLVQEGTGQTGAGAPLPAPDAIGGIGLSAESGKVALVSSSTLLTGSSPGGASITDFVGYGSANFAKGSPAPGLSNTTAVARREQGCSDSGSNAGDFTSAPPSPRNRNSALRLCN
ncbi:MAG: lamin tail domain-containing protein, partial [Verrucomicrobiales bacterium]|nr:lamin tail domain-containing protein [Verrucomicrobiales bacterium]